MIACRDHTYEVAITVPSHLEDFRLDDLKLLALDMLDTVVNAAGRLPQHHTEPSITSITWTPGSRGRVTASVQVRGSNNRRGHHASTTR